MADVYITVEWLEQGTMGENGRRSEWSGREIFTRDYPKKLTCHNPNCENGGFEIGEKIAMLLESRDNFEQNSLVCSNAVHPDKSKRCLHTISYSITGVFPHGRDQRKPPKRFLAILSRYDTILTINNYQRSIENQIGRRHSWKQTI